VHDLAVRRQRDAVGEPHSRLRHGEVVVTDDA
jgi:hypothetical protein